VSAPSSHGRTGWCHDDATGAERARFAVLHAHAYDWARRASLPAERAEDYAAWYAEEYVGDADPTDHRNAHDAWSARA